MVYLAALTILTGAITLGLFLYWIWIKEDKKQDVADRVRYRLVLPKDARLEEVIAAINEMDFTQQSANPQLFQSRWWKELHGPGGIGPRVIRDYPLEE